MQENFTKYRRQTSGCKPKSGTIWLNRTLSANMLEKAKILYHLNQELKKVLSEPINQHCWIINWSSDELMLGIDAAEWLIHVRACEKDLKTYLVQKIKMPSITKVKYLIRPKMDIISKNQSTSRRLPSKISTKNRSLLQAIANTITDKKLKAVLLSLASD